MTATNGQNGTTEKAAEAASSALAKLAPSSRGAISLRTREERLDARALTAWMLAESSPKKGRRRSVLFTLSARLGGGKKELSPITEGDVAKSLGDDARRERIAEIVADFDRASWEWAKSEANRGAQPFVVGGHKDDNPDTEWHVAFPFSVTPPSEARENFEGSERPDKDGVIAGLLREKDTLLRLWSKDSQQDKDRMLEELKSAREHNEALYQMRLEWAAQRETLADGAALRNIQVKKTEFELEVQNKIVIELMNRGLPFLAKLLGEPDGGAADPSVKIALALSPKKIAGLLEGMTPAEEEVLSPLLAVMLERMPEGKKAEVLRCMQERSAAGALVIDTSGAPPAPDATKGPSK
jgi:hypothetical protein